MIPEGAECDHCGNELEQDTDGDAGCCTSCGMPLPYEWRTGYQKEA